MLLNPTNIERWDNEGGKLIEIEQRERERERAFESSPVSLSLGNP